MFVSMRQHRPRSSSSLFSSETIISVLLLIVHLIIINLDASEGLAYEQTPPKLRSKGGDDSEPVEYAEGEQLVLSCPVIANPNNLFIDWYKDGNQINQDERITITLSGLLKIKRLYLQDAGTYTCHAINGFGSVKANLTVAVRREPEVDTDSDMFDGEDNNLYPKDPEPEDDETEPPSRKPEIIKPAASRLIRVPMGETLKMKCVADGYPKPKYRWYRNNEPVLLSNNRRSRNVIRIQSVATSDSGNYTCIAYNRAGETRRTFTLQVIPKFEEMKPRLIHVFPSNATVPFASRVSFQCRVKSRFKPHVEWLKLFTGPKPDSPQDGLQDGLILIDGNYFEVLASNTILYGTDVYFNKLVLSRVIQSDSGVYLCLAANHKGFNYQATSLEVLPPSPSSSVIETEELLPIDLPMNQYENFPVQFLALTVSVVICFFGMVLCVVCQQRRLRHLDLMQQQHLQQIQAQNQHLLFRQHQQQRALLLATAAAEEQQLLNCPADVSGNSSSSQNSSPRLGSQALPLNQPSTPSTNSTNSNNASSITSETSNTTAILVERPVSGPVATLATLKSQPARLIGTCPTL